MNLTEKIASVGMEVGVIEPDKDFGKYKSASLEKIKEVLKPFESIYKIWSYISNVNYVSGEIIESVMLQDKKEVQIVKFTDIVSVEVSFEDLETGDIKKVCAPSRGVDWNGNGVESAISIGFKSVLKGVYKLEIREDTGENESEPVKVLTIDELRERLFNYYEDHKNELKCDLLAFGCESFEDFTNSDIRSIIGKRIKNVE